MKCGSIVKNGCTLSENGKLEEYNGALHLTREGIFISDSIMSDLLWVD